MTPIDLDAIKTRMAAVVFPTEDDPHLYRLDPTEGCWIAYKPVDCVGEDELPETPTDLAVLVVEVERLRKERDDRDLIMATAVEQARVTGATVDDCMAAILRLTKMYRENERLRAVADMAWNLSAAWTSTATGYGDVDDAMWHLNNALAALDAWRGGEGA